MYIAQPIVAKFYIHSRILQQNKQPKGRGKRKKKEKKFDLDHKLDEKVNYICLT